MIFNHSNFNIYGTSNCVPSRNTWRQVKLRAGTTVTAVICVVAGLLIAGAGTATYFKHDEIWGTGKEKKKLSSLTDDEKIKLMSLFHELKADVDAIEKRKANGNGDQANTKKKLADASKVKKQLDSVASEIKSASDSLCEKIDRAINAISKHDFQGERLTFALVEQLAAELLVEVKSVITAHEKFVASAEDYERLLQEARPHFLEFEKEFRDSAEAEYYHDIRDNYLQLADIADSIDQKLDQSKSTIMPGVSRIKNSLRYANSTEVFLEKLNKFLQGIPENQVDPEELVSRLETYVSRFHEMQGVLKRFSTTLKTQTEPEKKPIANADAQSDSADGVKKAQ